MVLFHEFFLFCTSFYNQIDALFSNTLFKKTKKAVYVVSAYTAIYCLIY